jgi:hypothetical protein
VSFFKKWFKKKKGVVDTEEVRYILKKQLPGQGMAKVAELKEPLPIDDLYQSLSPGIYSLHKYKKGQTGFEVVWGPVEVLGEEQTAKEATVTTRSRSVFSGVREIAEDFKAMKEDLSAFFETFGPMFGYGKGGQQKTLIEQLKEAREMKDTLDKIFPTSTTKSQEIPIAGSIPAWMVYAPKVVDESMDNIERRLAKWGVIGESSAGAAPKEIIKLPEKPKVVKTEVVKLPEKPKEEIEAKKASEEKESGESEESGS